MTLKKMKWKSSIKQNAGNTHDSKKSKKYN